MMHKGRAASAFLTLLALFSPTARADRRAMMVVETSTSGKLVKISLGAKNGLVLGEPVLFTAVAQKIAAGRVIRVEDSDAVVAVLEKYGSESPMTDADYELVFGEPFPEAANLPDYVADRDEELPNPGNEKFLQPTEAETTPELDDDNYSPEITIHPKFPLPRTYSPHNITIGANLFRNHALPGVNDIDSAGNVQATGFTAYPGWSVRYAYTFRTNMWLKSETTALLSAEIGLGMYTFSYNWPTQIAPTPQTNVSQIRVMPIQLELRYLIEVSRMFRLYPYAGYQYNLVGAVNGSLVGLGPLMGGSLLGGVGAVLVMSEKIDTRLEAGTDGVLGGLVVKF